VTRARSTLAVVFAALLLLLPVAPSAESRAQEATVRREAFLMGTTVALEVVSPDREVGLGQLEAALRVLEDTERQLSTWVDTSALSQLNGHPRGQPFRLDSSLCRMFDEIEDWFLRSGGRFDPAVGALIDAWGLRAEPRRPDPATLSAAMDRSGFHQLRFSALWCEVTRLGEVRIDAGAFGKGEALDRVGAWFANGVSEMTIDLGGQIMVYGMSPDRPRMVGLAHPRFRERPVGEIALSAGSLATSGGSERDVADAGERIGHILDPLTGETISRSESVVVWHERALVADILSTALYVMGPDEGLWWADAEGIVACFLVPADGRVELRPTTRFIEKFLAGSRP